MRKFLIASHHNFSKGLMETVHFITSIDNIKFINAYVDDVSLEDEIALFFQHVSEEDEVFIFTDMIGGSVNQKFYPLINEHVHLIAGANVPVVLAFVLNPVTEPLTKEQIEQQVSTGREQLIYVNDYANHAESGDE